MTAPEHTDVRDPALACHDALLRVAGRAPDDLLPTAREWLAEGRHADVARAVTFAALSYRVPLSEADVLGLADILAGAGVDPGALGQVEVVVADVAPPFLFSPSPDGPVAVDPPDGADDAEGTRPAGGPAHAAPNGDTPDDVDLAAAAAIAGEGVRGLWRAWRVPADGSPWPASRRVYVLEISAAAERPAAAAHLQRALMAVGETSPQVETYATGEDLPSYQRLARAGGTLLWAASPDREVRIATVFDHVDEEGTPSFDPDHGRLADPDERERLVAYLAAGAPLLVTTALADDLLDPDRGAVVPMSFRTDGTWIWSDAATYYLDEHGVEPDADLLAHLRAHAHALPRVDGVDIHRAVAALSG